jgi:HSP20 family protein
MALMDLVSWNRGRQASDSVPVRRGQPESPFLALHREVDRLLDDAFRGFGLVPVGSSAAPRRVEYGGWPNVEVSDNGKEIKVTAELPGLDEKDVAIDLANGVLSITGEKRLETDDKERLFSERFYGRFERRIPVEEVEEDKVSASFRNGLLTVTLPKSVRAQQSVKRIPINGH